MDDGTVFIIIEAEWQLMLASIHPVDE